MSHLICFRMQGKEPDSSAELHIPVRYVARHPLTVWRNLRELRRVVNLPADQAKQEIMRAISRHAETGNLVDATFTEDGETRRW